MNHADRTESEVRPPTVEHQVFVYGTLKEGLRNFHVNRGRRVAGEFVTLERFPLYLIGPEWLPWLLNAPGQGQAVIGQIYRVDDAGLAAMDKLEQIDEAGWYERRRIALRPRGDAQAAPVEAWVYFGSLQGLQASTVHLGPLAEFTAEHNALKA